MTQPERSLDRSRGLGYNDGAGRVDSPGRRGQADSSRRVLRGGSFNNNENNARCSYRNNNDPDNDWNNNGCRVCWCAAHDSLDAEGSKVFTLLLGQKCRGFTDPRPRPP